MFEGKQLKVPTVDEGRTDFSLDSITEAGMKDKDSQNDITKILHRVEMDDDSAAAEVLPIVYDELRALAVSFFKSEDPNHTLQPTALVHEAFIKLAGKSRNDWKNRAHFFAIASKAMRWILKDHARRKKAIKRGGAQQKVTLSGIEEPSGEKPINLIALDESLAKLAERSPRTCRIVEMRFLAGLDEKEVAYVLDIALRTVQREWRVARAYLRCELSGESLL